LRRKRSNPLVKRGYKSNMVFKREPAVPPFVQKLLSIMDNPPTCLRLLANYFAYRDIVPRILVVLVYDGMPGLVNAFCKGLDSYISLLKKMRTNP